MEPKEHEVIKLHVDPNYIKEAKNLDGLQGERCNNCGGFGFTMNIKGGRLDCNDCQKTGVRIPTILELQAQISDLRQDLLLLKKALIETLQSKGVVIKTNIEEANHVGE